MREGRRRAHDKKRRSAIGSAVRNGMLAAMLRLFGRVEDIGEFVGH
jgi:hypothetical protein